MSTTDAAFWLEAGPQTMSPTSYHPLSTDPVHHTTTSSAPSTNSEATNAYQQAFLSSLAKGLNDPRYSDMTLMGSIAIFKVHKLIVCPQSTWIASQVERRNQTRHSAEITDRTITIATSLYFPSSADDDTLGRVVSFLYRQDYDAAGEPTTSTKHICEIYAECGLCQKRVMADELLAHSRIVAAAEFLGIPFLTRLAERNFLSLLATYSRAHHMDGLLAVAEHVYSISEIQSCVMRDALVDIAVKHAQKLSVSLRFIQALRETGLQDFAADLVVALMKKLVVSGVVCEDGLETGTPEEVAESDEWVSAEEKQSEGSIDSVLGRTF